MFQPSTKHNTAMTPSGLKEKSGIDTKSAQNSDDSINKEDDYWQEQESEMFKQKLEAQMADWRKQSDGIREFLRLSGIY